MKKLLLTTIAVISMSLVSFAGDVNVTLFNANGDNTETIEKAKPHTQQYKDIKEILDEFEQDVNKAKSCEELEDAQLTMFIKLMGLVEKEYEEDLTSEEDEELTGQMNRIDQKVTKLQEQWGCETDDEDYDDSGESVKPTTSAEWEEILDDFDALTNKLEGMKDVDFDDEENMGIILEFVFEAQPLLERIESADPETLTDRQRERLESINNKFTSIAKQMGMMGDD